MVYYIHVEYCIVFETIPTILSSDTPNFLEIIAASVNVNGTSPRNRRYTASLPMNKISISTFAKLLFAGIFSLMASMRPVLIRLLS